MKEEDILKEIKQTEETIKKLEEIKLNSEKGLEVNRFVLSKFKELL